MGEVPLPFSPRCLLPLAVRQKKTPLVKLYLVFLSHPPIETLSVNDPPDVLDRQKCLAALASLRHAKWFQVCILSLFVFYLLVELFLFVLSCREHIVLVWIFICLFSHILCYLIHFARWFKKKKKKKSL